VIRPFQPGDIVLLQRLHGQATRLNSTQALLHAYSPPWAALTAVKPWGDPEVATYVLRQNGHGLARTGFLQAQRSPDREQAKILLIAPALDTRTGHPAIWEKLLSHYVQEEAQRQTLRIYADVPDQPLLVNTLTHVGFRSFVRQTVWRLGSNELSTLDLPVSPFVRPSSRSDDWALLRLYTHLTPKAVQVAEGSTSPGARPPMLDWWQAGESRTWIWADARDLHGCLRISVGRLGIRLQVWSDAHRNNQEVTRDLLRVGLAAARNSRRLPIYVAVREYQAGLGPLLSDFGFAPFVDHAKMVNLLVQRVPVLETQRVPAVEVMPEALVTFDPVHQSAHAEFTLQSPASQGFKLRHRRIGGRR
jgi:hypothetical protein